MSLTLSPNCSVCGTKANVSKCTACNVTFYYGRGHQVSDRPEHKGACNAVKRALVGPENQEAELRATPGDFMTPPGATIFEEHAGHFWGIYETRPYMRARYALVEALLKIKTYASVEAALNHLDQECYDFVKWWATTGQRGNYDWGDMNEPYLDLKDENPFEIRILFDCRALKSAAVIGEKVPQEVLDNIYNRMVGTIVAQRQDIMEGKNLDPLIEDLQTQVSDMYHAVNDSNKYFWSALLRPGANLIARPGAYNKGSEAEMQLMFQYSYNSWAETPGAINYIRTLVTNVNC
ncbi:hypothetical protein VE03_08000 [Pseudogymnoascus sp. 23342-1-I1]|nr:hypothetical protein VE03_08000 [Pseudogymnoascus sp. 23342-1-I1]